MNQNDTDGEKFQHLPARDDGREQCVRCGEVFGGEKASLEVTHTSGPVVHAERGAEYEVVIKSPPGAPFMHPECFTEADAERKAEKNAFLTGFSHG
jgi:hypothetical protein